MNKLQNAQLTSQISSDGVLTENADKFISNPAFIPAKANVVNGIAISLNLAKTQDTLQHTSTAAKTASRNAAISFTFELASNITTYAIVNNDVELMNKVKITATKLNKMSDNNLVSRIKTILSCGTDNLPELAGFNVTQQTLTDGLGLLNDLISEMQKLALRKIELNEVTKNLGKQLKITDTLLKIMDAFVEPKRISDPELYSLYENARRIKKSATGRIAASGKVYDTETNLPLRGAMMTVLRAVTGKSRTSGADLVKNVKIKSASGGFQLKSLPTGTYIFRVTYAGYADQEITVYINDGVLSKVDMALSKIASTVS